MEVEVEGVPESERDGVRDKDGEGLERNVDVWRTPGRKPNLGLPLLLCMETDMGGGGPVDIETGLLIKPISRSPLTSRTDSISTSGSWPRSGTGDMGKSFVDAKDERVGESECDAMW